MDYRSAVTLKSYFDRGKPTWWILQKHKV